MATLNRYYSINWLFLVSFLGKLTGTILKNEWSTYFWTPKFHSTSLATKDMLIPATTKNHEISAANYIPQNILYSSKSLRMLYRQFNTPKISPTEDYNMKTSWFTSPPSPHQAMTVNELQRLSPHQAMTVNENAEKGVNVCYIMQVVLYNEPYLQILGYLLV